ncbi:TPA: lngG [Escherichia coli]|nr:lngG [Escherichia coli]
MHYLTKKFSTGILFIGITVCGSVSADQSTKKTELVTSTGQEQIIQMLEDDLNFETQRKQLSNELALEKLRLELNKLKSESQPVLQPSQSASLEQKIDGKPVSVVQAPAIVLVSEVAGLSRILVKDGDKVNLYHPSETFIANNGNKYKFTSHSGAKFILKEVK